MRVQAAVIFILLAGLLGMSAAHGQEYVTVKKDGSGDYASIQAALDDLGRPYNEIVVFPGLYQENLLISSDVTLRAYEGPYLTGIDGSLHTGGRQDAVVVNQDLSDVKLIGLYITNGNFGVNVKTGAKILVANCVIANMTSHGVYLDWISSGNITRADIYNNIIMSNTGAGIYFMDDLTGRSGSTDAGYYTIMNNIIVQNLGSGMSSRESSIYYVDRVVVDYNNVNGNTPANYSNGIGSSSSVKPGAHEQHENPLFIADAPSGIGADVRLQEDSLCKHKGNESNAFNNPDGTRNDMGAFGGPYCATFFESPADGPIVRNVHIVPGSVPQGETFSIQATVAVR